MSLANILIFGSPFAIILAYWALARMERKAATASNDSTQ